MQKVIFKFLIINCLSLFITSLPTQAKASEAELISADSLYQKKQYTQALKKYNKIFSEGYSSPSMLLKMARINEGKKELGLSLYYLEKYYQLTQNKKVLTYAEKLAEENKLSGFSYDFSFFVNYFYKFSRVYGLAALCLLLVVWMLRYARKENKNKGSFGTIALLLIIFAAAINNYQGQQYVISTEAPTYMMEGPSSASPMLQYIQQPAKMTLIGEVDKWSEVVMEEKRGYIQTDDLKKLY